jgi:hypothetical protein
MGDVFQQTLQRGQIAERILATRFLELGCGVEWTNEEHTGRDMLVRMRGELFGIEVKDEQNYAESGRIAIERQQNEHRDPSGIAITTADIWIHVFGPDGPYVIYRVIPMKRFLSRYKDKYRILQFGQSDNSNRGHLVPIAILQTHTWADYCETADELYMSKVWAAQK